MCGVQWIRILEPRPLLDGYKMIEMITVYIVVLLLAILSAIKENKDED